MILCFPSFLLLLIYKNNNFCKNNKFYIRFINQKGGKSIFQEIKMDHPEGQSHVVLDEGDGGAGA